MTIPTLPSAPLVTDIPADFNTKAFNWVAALDNWTTEANATGVAADADAATATSAAGTATTQAGTATTQAGIATSAASTATTQAGIATTKAGEANASAVAAAASAASINLNSIDINGGTIDGTVIGGSSAAAGSFTAVSASGQIQASAAGAAIKINGVAASPAYLHLDNTAQSGKIWRVGYSGGSGGSANTFDIYDQTDNINVGVFSSTGLAVTGAVSASGVISTTNGSASTITAILAKHSYDPNFQLSSKTGAGGSGVPGDEMSRFGANYNGSWDSFTQYKRGSGTQNGSQVLWAGNTAVVDITSTGLAVTGALSATGTATTVFGTSMSAGQTFGPAGTGGGVFINTPSLSASYNSGLAIDGSYAGGAALSTINLKALGVYSGGGYASNLAFWTSNETTASEKMRLDTSGNLGLGVTPSAFPTTKTLEMPNGVMFSSWQGYSTYGILQNNYHDGTSWKYKTTNVASRFCANDGNTGGFQWYTAPSGTAGNAITFTQAMTLDASGNLLVRATSTTPATGGFVAVNGSAMFTRTDHASGSASGEQYAQFTYAGAVIGSITQSGTTAVLYNTTSDARLKENITDANDAASLIDALQVRQFDWKSDGSHQRYGFVAQELYEVAPEAVSKPQDPDEMMAVDYSKLVPMLVKEIQSLRARVAQLEGI